MHASAIRPPRAIGESVVAAVIFAAVAVAVAAVGGLITSDRRGWYDTLDKPDFTPPNATFGIVWTVLYVAIAVAGWLAWRASTDAAPTVWWAIQMALNFLWTAVFFGLQAPWGGIVVIGALLGAVVMNLRLASAVSTTAAVLLFPYLVWCGFAAALNIGVAVLN